MAVVHEAHSGTQGEPKASGCPVDYAHGAYKKSVRPHPSDGVLIERDSNGVWQVRGFEEVRAILRSNNTKQAGFRAELVNMGNALRNRPILYQEGKVHQEQRTKTARFFTPRTVSNKYRRLMERLSDRIVAYIVRKGRADLSKLSMALAVRVTGRVVGLTNSTTRGLDRRLDAFFADTTVSHKNALLSRLTQVVTMRRLLMFYWLDVRPAIRARRIKPGDDVISHLLSEGYNDQEILTECITYAAAGMATTREFICMAAWHLLEHPDLRARYMVAPEEERVAMLHEMLRLEPVVGHLYRRVTADITLKSEGETVVIPEGDLIDLHIESANVDERVVGEDPTAVCPGRPIKAERAGPMLASFGDGAHRCPGAYLAIQETDIFLKRLLALDGLRIEQPPTLTFDELTAGYLLRRFIVAIEPSPAS
jgi:cytochrome P450